MKDLLLYLWKSNQHYAMQLLGDIDEGRLAEQPVGLPNHPAWTIAHLSVASNYLLVPALGETLMDLAGWDQKFGYGTKPLPDRSAYPSKEELIGIYTEQHRLVEQGIKSNFDGVIGVETPDESMRAYFPTLDKMVGYMVSIHEANHWGQVCDWRRAIGLPNVM